MPPLDQSAAELRSQARAESIENRAKMLSSMKKALSVAYDATGTRLLNKAVTQGDLDALAAAGPFRVGQSRLPAVLFQCHFCLKKYEHPYLYYQRMSHYYNLYLLVIYSYVIY